jgi:hypothetical protein
LRNHKKFYYKLLSTINASYKRWLLNVAIALLYVLLCVFICLLFVLNSNTNGNHEQTFRDMLDGTAFKPYVYRVLVPMLLRCVNLLSPHSIENFVNQELSKYFPYFIDHYHVDPDLAYLGVWSVVFYLISLLIYCRLLYLGGYHIVGLPRAQAAITPLLGLLMLPPFFRQGYIYDLPQLALFSACLYLMFRQKWGLYFLLFALLCLNKETSIIILFVYLATYVDKHASRSLFIVSLLHLFIYGTIRLLLEQVFQNNHGVSMQIHIIDQVKVFLEIWNFGALSQLIAALFIITYKWENKSVFLRRSLILAAPLTLLFMVGGSPGEYRVFYEVVYVVTLLTFHSITAAWQSRV